MAAVRVDSGELDWLADPAGTETVSFVPATADHTEAVEPPAITAKELTHSNLCIIKV
jgi:hypothetical protein